MKTEIYYRWRVKNHMGKWYTTRHEATEEMIRKSHPEAVREPGPGIARQVPGTPEELMEAMCRSHGGGYSPDKKP